MLVPDLDQTLTRYLEKHRVLTAGPPEKSLHFVLDICFQILCCCYYYWHLSVLSSRKVLIQYSQATDIMLFSPMMIEIYSKVIQSQRDLALIILSLEVQTSVLVTFFYNYCFHLLKLM